MVNDELIPIEILLVEDNPGDVLLTKEAFSGAKISNNLHIVRDGEEALAYLNKTDGFEDAIQRTLAFREVGCDMTFLEAPESVEQMEEYCSRVSGPKLANMLEYGTTPILPPEQLKELGYTMAAYPLTLLSASIKAMQESLQLIKDGKPTDDMILSFTETKDVVGFTSYSKEEMRYAVE